MNDSKDVKNFLSGALVAILIILYVISPVDLVPGPIDDVVLAALGIYGASRKKIED